MRVLYYLESVGCLIDEKNYETFPASKDMIDDKFNRVYVVAKDDYLPEDSVAFENVTDEWLMKLSSKDIRIIIKLMLKQKR
jgi:hypothetical protein